MMSRLTFLRSAVAIRAALLFGLSATPLVATRADAMPESSLPSASPEEVIAVLSALPPAPVAQKATPVRDALAAQKRPAAEPLSKPQPQSAPQSAPPTETMQGAARRLNLALPLPAARVVILKSRRELQVWSADTHVKTYRVALGNKPVGHKAQQGDGRTPEGEFFVCTRNSETSAFHIFLGLSYPALPDAQRGLQSRAISEREFLDIRARLASRSVPLWRTRLGGWVGIHGGTGESFARKQSATRKSKDWTAGCIALTNREIEEIYAATRLGTPVSVRP